MREGTKYGASSPVALAATPLSNHLRADWKGHTLHATTDPSINALADQIESERDEAKRLAPHNRFFLSDPRIKPMLHHALAGLDANEAKGAVPVIRCGSAFGGPSTEHTRNGTSPITSRAPVQYCNVCGAYISSAVPFWVARGQYVVQIDMCGLCADEYVSRGAVAQTSTPE